MITSLQVYCWVRWWKNFEYRSIFGKVMEKSVVTRVCKSADYG